MSHALVNRRAFLRSVIVGTLAAPFVTRGVKAEEWATVYSGPATNEYWQRQMQPVDQTAAFENLRAVMRDINAQCRRDLAERGIFAGGWE